MSWLADQGCEPPDPETTLEEDMANTLRPFAEIDRRLKAYDEIMVLLADVTGDNATDKVRRLKKMYQETYNEMIGWQYGI